MSEQTPTVLGGRYELHRRLARGGMADVFLARDQLLDRPVAVKVLFSQFAADPTFVERFLYRMGKRGLATAGQAGKPDDGAAMTILLFTSGPGHSGVVPDGV